MSEKEIEYKTIVDDKAFALSEIYDLPQDKEKLKQLQSLLPDDHPVTIRRQATVYEAAAYGMDGVEIENALVSLVLKPDDSVFRVVLRNSSGFFRTEMCEDWNYERAEDGELSGHQLANYVAACQGREGHVFDEECKRIKFMTKIGGLTGAQQALLHVCLLQPSLDLEEITRLTDIDSSAYQDKSNFEYELSPEILSELKLSLQRKGIQVTSGEARIWIEFCTIRSRHYFHSGSSEFFSHLYDPIFSEIDEALEDHQLFSALIIGPKFWARPSNG